jgi:branched-chain amino acid transport system substrate-binding protein
LRFKMLIGNGAGYSQLDKLTDTFHGDIEDFCNIDPVPAQLLDATKLAPGLGDLIKIMVERYQAKTGAKDVPPHVSMGFNPDLASAAERAAGRHPEIRRRRSRGDPPGGARRRHPGRRHDPGLRRQVLSTRHAALGAERALEPGGHAVRQGGNKGRLANRHPKRRPG